MKRKIKNIITRIRNIIPEWAILFYHRLWAVAGAIRYGSPSKGMRIIGITGTKGKTSTGYFVHALLSAHGEKVGLISTAVIRSGKTEDVNRRHMTMPGRAVIQSLLHQMKNDGCTTVIVESTSEGIKYNRHIGIYYDTLIFTNLTPEHLSSHNNSFEEYKAAKMTIFKQLYNQMRKGHSKQIIANVDDPHGMDFLQCEADRKISFGIENGDKKASNISTGKDFTEFVYDDTPMRVSLGTFNVYNALPGIILASQDGMSPKTIAQALKKVPHIPGRMEYIMKEPFTVIVDYAHEPTSMKKALEAVRSSIEKENQVIAIVGGVGGGRDMNSRRGIGTEAAKNADIVFITDVDPYDEPPEDIAEDVSETAQQNGKKIGKDLFIELDRRTAIRKALQMAKKGDAVLVTGKGAELTYIKKDGAEPWDERAIVREEAQKVLHANASNVTEKSKADEAKRKTNL